MLPTVAKIQIDIPMTLEISCPSERPRVAVVVVFGEGWGMRRQSVVASCAVAGP